MRFGSAASKITDVLEKVVRGGKMIAIEFTEAHKQSLHYERFYHPHPRVQKKMEALWLKSQGLPHREITKLTGISANTLRTYLKEYQFGGIEKLKQVNFYRPESDLVHHVQTLEDYFRLSPPTSINEAIVAIESLTGIKRSPTQVRKFLLARGMRCLKTGVIPSKADPDQQLDYKKKART